MKNAKKIVNNFLKNTLSYAFPVALLQFVVQPFIANNLGAEENGLYLTLIAVVYFITSITAATLLHVRLLKNSEYEEKKLSGDFNVLLLIFSFIIVVFMLCAVTFYFDSPKLEDYVLCVLVGILYLLHDYMCVDYRLELNYTKILISNICLCIGYVVGIIVYRVIYSEWTIIFICAYGICFIYDYNNTRCLSEKLNTTPLLKSTLKKYGLLASASFLGYLVTYGDRIILYPVTDGASVSIFTSAEIIGKLLMLLSTPLSSFFLAYIVRTNELDLRFSKKIYGIIIAMACVLYLGCLIVSYPMLQFLYPKWAVKSLRFVPFTTLTSLTNLFSSILNVIIIRFCHSKSQIVISATYLVVYLVVSFSLLEMFGLMGYCIGNTVAALIKFIQIIIIIKKNMKLIANESKLD